MALRANPSEGPALAKRTVSPASPPPAESAPASYRGATPARGGRGRGTIQGRQGLDDRRDEETKARDLDARHKDATAEPRITIVLVEPPGSQTASGVAPGPGTVPLAGPAPQPSDVADKSAPPDASTRLLRYLFPGGPSANVCPDFDTSTLRGAASTRDRIRLRVTLLPPAPPATTATRSAAASILGSPAAFWPLR